MTTRQRTVRSLNTRSASGAIGVAEAKFSTGWSSATGTLISDDTLVETALKLISTKLVRGDRLESPRATRQYLSLRFASLEHEVFCCLWLDNRHRVIACDELFRGTIDGASVHPREVVKPALAQNAAAVILAHNHPSGVAEPSQADELVTHRLKDALAIVDIRVLDHLIVAGDQVVSGGRVDIKPDQPLLLASVGGLIERGTMLMPTLAPGFGPFADRRACWVDPPEQWAGTWFARRAAVCLYAALVADTSLDLIGSKERLLIEGRFAEAEVFVRALAALRPDTEVYVANAHNDVSFGALRLVNPALAAQGSLRRVEPLDGDILGYRSKWRRQLAEVAA